MQTIWDVSWLSKIKRKTPKMVHIKVKQELSDPLQHYDATLTITTRQKELFVVLPFQDKE